MSDRGKIRARRVTGNCAQHQRDVAVAIKTARELALLPYTSRVTEQRGGRAVATAATTRRGRGRRDERCADEPSDDRRRGRDRPSADDLSLGEASSDVPRRSRHERSILRADVDSVGKKGDIVDVADGYARNYLIPKGSAMQATAGVEAQAEPMRRSRDVQGRQADRESAEEVATRARARRSSSITAKAGEPRQLFGSVIHEPRSRRPCRPRPASSSTASGSHLDEPIRTVGTHDVMPG